MSRVSSGTGTVASVIGQSMTLTIIPKCSYGLCRILASGDMAATILTGMAGEGPIVLDPIAASLLSPSAYHGPTFDGSCIQAGVPVTFSYVAGSTTAALTLTLLGD